MNGFKPTYRIVKLRPQALKGVRLFDTYIKGEVDVDKAIDKFVKRKVIVGYKNNRNGWSKILGKPEIEKRETDEEIIVVARLNGFMRRLTIKKKGVKVVKR